MIICHMEKNLFPIENMGVAVTRTDGAVAVGDFGLRGERRKGGNKENVCCS